MGRFIGVNMAEIVVGSRAYCKIILHAAKYPHCAINGVLLTDRTKGKDSRSVKFVDAIPLFHLSLTLAPMMEVALTQIDTYCKENNYAIGGYYHANEHAEDVKPTITAQKVADKIYEQNDSACLIMVQNSNLSLDCTMESLDLYTCNDGKWAKKNQSELLEAGSLEMASSLLCSKAYREIVDFDNHLDDVALDWQNQEINEQLSISS